MKPVFVDVTKLLEETGRELAYSAPVALDAAKLGEENIDFPRPFQVRLVFTNVGEGIRVAGSAEGLVRLQCSRCLDIFDYQVKLDLDELAVRDKAAAGREDVFEIEAGKINLAPLLYQNVMVEVPFRPLCRADCAGLCQVCGKNLNIEPHTHEKKEIDERLAPLKDFFKKP